MASVQLPYDSYPGSSARKAEHNSYTAYRLGMWEEKRKSKGFPDIRYIFPVGITISLYTIVGWEEMVLKTFNLLLCFSQTKQAVNRKIASPPVSLKSAGILKFYQHLSEGPLFNQISLGFGNMLSIKYLCYQWA